MSLAAEWDGGLIWRAARSLRERTPRLTVAVRPHVDVWTDRRLPQWVTKAVERLYPILDLQRGWDGEKAEPVHTDAVQMALMILAQTMAPDSIAPHFVPTADGGIQLEWHCAGVDLEVYVEPDGRVSAWCREGSREWEESIYPRAKLTKELSLLTGTLCD